MMKRYRPILNWTKAEALQKKIAADPRLTPELRARAKTTARLLRKFKPLRDQLAKSQAPNN